MLQNYVLIIINHNKPSSKMPQKPYTTLSNLQFAARAMGYEIKENAKAAWFDADKVRHIYFKVK